MTEQACKRRGLVRYLGCRCWYCKPTKSSRWWKRQESKAARRAARTEIRATDR